MDITTLEAFCIPADSTIDKELICSEKNILLQMNMRDIRREMAASKTGNQALLDTLATYKNWTEKTRWIARTRCKSCCYWCNQQAPTNRTSLKKHWRIDLIRSVSAGGYFACENLIVSCVNCFKRRYALPGFTDNEWYQYCKKNLDYRNSSKTKEFLSDYRSHRDWITYINVYQEFLFKQAILTAPKSSQEPSTHASAVRRNIPLEDLKQMKKKQVRLKQRAKELSTKNKKVLRKTLIERGEVSCVWCQKLLDFNNLSLDHMIPISHGGSHWIENILPSCETCNNHRMSLPAEVFARYALKPNLDLLESRTKKINDDPRKHHSFWKMHLSFYHGKYNRATSSRYILDIVPKSFKSRN